MEYRIGIIQTSRLTTVVLDSSSLDSTVVLGFDSSSLDRAWIFLRPINFLFQTHYCKRIQPCPITATQELMALKQFSRRTQELTSTSTMAMMPLFRRWPLPLVKNWPLWRWPLPLVKHWPRTCPLRQCAATPSCSIYLPAQQLHPAQYI